MIHRVIFIVLMLYSFVAQKAWSDIHSKERVWEFDKISEKNLFGKKDNDTINHLNAIYGKVTIHIGETKIHIDNDLLESNYVCSSDYVNIKKTPLSYFFSQKTVDIYDQLLKNEGVHFSRYISIIKSLYPEQSCPPPYDELMKVNESLIFFDDNFAVIFKEVNSSNKVSADNAAKESFSTYCHNKTKNDAYDGISKYTCLFTGLDLKEAFKKLNSFKVFTYDLKDKLPLKNEKEVINGGFISYVWMGDKNLKVSISYDGEMAEYSFDEKSSGTELEITETTQY
jgi:hypothetical protein